MAKHHEEPAEAVEPPKSAAEKVEAAKAKAAKEPDTQSVVIQAANVSFAPIAPLAPQYDPAKAREDTRLGKGDHEFAVRTIMKQLGATQEQAEDALAELDQTQCNDLIDAANSNRIDHIHRVLGGVTLKDSDNLPDSNATAEVRNADAAQEAAAQAEGKFKEEQAKDAAKTARKHK